MRAAFVVVCLSLAVASRVTAQDQGATAGLAVSAARIDSATAFSFSGSVGYQLSPVVTFEIEAIAAPRVKLLVDASTPVAIASASGGIASVGALTAIYPGLVVNPTNGRAVIFTTNIRVHVRAPAARVAPFFLAGGGGANVRRAMDVTLPVLELPPGVTIPVRPITQHATTSATDLALTAGGGVDVRFATHLAVSVELQYFRLFSERDFNVGRFAAGVRYRF